MDETTQTPMAETPATLRTAPVGVHGRRIPSSFPLDDATVPILVERVSLETVQEIQTGYRALNPPGEVIPPETHAKRMRYAKDQIAKYITLPEGAMVDVDDQNRPIRTGQELVTVLGARQDVILGLYMLLMWENTVSADEKKTLKSQLGSDLGWPSWITPMTGPEHARIVTRVARLVSQAVADASDPSDAAPVALSGDLAPSSSDAARSDALTGE